MRLLSECTWIQLQHRSRKKYLMQSGEKQFEIYGLQFATQLEPFFTNMD